MKKFLVVFNLLLTVVFMSCVQPIDDVIYDETSNIDDNNDDNIKKWNLIDESGLFLNKEYDSKENIIDEIKNYIGFDYNDKISFLSEKLKFSEYIRFFIDKNLIKCEYEDMNNKQMGIYHIIMIHHQELFIH